MTSSLFMTCPSCGVTYSTPPCPNCLEYGILKIASDESTFTPSVYPVGFLTFDEKVEREREVLGMGKKVKRKPPKVSAASPKVRSSSRAKGKTEAGASSFDIDLGPLEEMPIITDTVWSFNPVLTITEERKDEPMSEKINTKNHIKGYHLSQEVRLVFNSALRKSYAEPEHAVKIMMVGPSGYGKTEIPRLFAQASGLDFMRMNCASIRDPEEWFGFREARDGSTVFIRSRFMNLLEKGHAVIVLDEFNRLEPWLHNTLFPLLDQDGYTVVHDEEFRIGESVIVVGTINTGYKYTGTFELDEALLNRFDLMLEVGPLLTEDECRVLQERSGVDSKQAKAIVKVANILRQNDFVCSTRSTLLIASLVSVGGMTVREAFENAVVRRVSKDSGMGNSQRKVVVDLINPHLGAFEPRDIQKDVFDIGLDCLITPEPAEEQDETGTYDRAKAFIIKRKETGEVNTLALIRLMRLLPVKDSISLSEANQLASAVKGGERIVIPLTKDVEDLESIINSLNALGTEGIYRTVLDQKPAIWKGE